MKRTNRWKRATLVAVAAVAVAMLLGYLPGLTANSAQSSGHTLLVSWNAAPANKFHAPVSAMGSVGLTGARPHVGPYVVQGLQPAIGGGPGSIPVNALRFTTDTSYIPMSETTLAANSHSGTTLVLGAVNDARFFFCPALPASDCPSGFVNSLSGFTIGTVTGVGTASVVMSNDAPGLAYTSTTNASFHGFLVSFGDPSLASGPGSVFYYASLAIDPITGNNGIELEKSTSTLWTSPASCVSAPAPANPTTNPCWTTKFVFGNLSGFVSDLGGPNARVVNSPGTFEDKELAAVDNDPASAFFGDVYVSWDHFSNDGTSHSFLARCTSALSCTMLDGALPVTNKGLSGPAWPFAAFTTVVVGPDGGVHVTFCNYGTTTTLGPITCLVTSSPAGGASFGAKSTTISFMGAGTMFPGFLGIDGLATEQFRTFSIPDLAVDQSHTFTSGNLYFVITVCVAGNYYAFAAPALSGNCGSAGVFFARSTDNGATWSHPVELSPDGKVNVQPWVTVDATTGNVVVSYYTTAFDPFDHLIDVQSQVSRSGFSWTTIRETSISDEPNSDPVYFDWTIGGGFGGSFVVPQFGDYFQSIAVGGEIWTAFTGDYAKELGTFHAGMFLVAHSE